MNNYFVMLLTLFRMGLFGAAHGSRRGGGKGPYFSKICHTYSTMMKLGTVTLPKEDPKIFKSSDTTLEFC